MQSNDYQKLFFRCSQKKAIWSRHRQKLQPVKQQASSTTKLPETAAAAAMSNETSLSLLSEL